MRFSFWGYGDNNPEFRLVGLLQSVLISLTIKTHQRHTGDYYFYTSHIFLGSPIRELKPELPALIPNWKNSHIKKTLSIIITST
jgi:hypothetical protein